MMTRILQFLIAFTLMISPVTFAVTSNSKLDYAKYEYQVNENQTFTLTVTQQITVLTNFGAKSAQKQAISYYPDAEEVKILTAYCIKKEGTRMPIDSTQIFTRSADSHPSSPGFDTRLTKTVVFPTLSAEDTTFLRYQIVRKKPMISGFGALHTPDYGLQMRKQEVEISLPKSMYMRWTKQGDYKVNDQIRGDVRIIRAELENFPEIFNENNMADLGQNLPYFIASSAQSWDEIAVKFWEGFDKNITPTQEIITLAKQITNNKTGEAAARAIHSWVAQNIHYIALFLDEGSGFVPHSASSILANGYGDCKDHTALMLALLRAVNIEGYPALVQLGSDYFSYPLPNAFQFNHVIVYIPSFKTFTDPTNEFSTFGVLGQYTANKFVVVGAPKPMVAQTAIGQSTDGTYSCTKKMTINNDGDITGEAIIRVTGRLNTSSRALFSGAIEKILANDTLQNTEGGVGNIETSDPRDLDHDMFITANWISPQAINMEDDETFFTIPIGIDFKDPRAVRPVIQQEARKFPTLIGAGQIHWDTVITLPKDYQLNHLPKNRHFSNEAGEYISEYLTSNGKLFVSRKFVVNKDVYSAQEYATLRSLLFETIKDATSVVSIKKSIGQG